MSSYFNCTILIDDDQISNYITEKIVKKLCLSGTVKVATNGAEGLQILKECCRHKELGPILVLLDLNMPVMSGHEFLKEFNKEKRLFETEVKIVVLTTSSHAQDIEKAEKHRIAGYINKPLTEEKIIKLLEVLSVR